MEPLRLLLHNLESLTAQELKKFQLFLTNEAWEGRDRIPKGKLEKCEPTNTAEIMREVYGGDGALRVTLLILKKMNHNDLAVKLEKELEKRAPPPSQTQVFTSAQVEKVPARDYKPGQIFFSQHKLSLEIRMTGINNILGLLEQRGVLNAQERKEVMSKPANAQNYELLTMIVNKGARAKQEFYEILKEQNPLLVEDLEESSCGNGP